MTDIPLWLPMAFFGVALVYSMAGFAGGSSYLALLLMAGFSYQQAPSVVLVCNLIVSASTFWCFYRAGHFSPQRTLPFALLSVPMAFVGAQIDIGKDFFYLLLGFSLLIASSRILLAGRDLTEKRRISTPRVWAIGVPIGGILGFLSGLIGIGGGIFLSPILFLTRWLDTKQIAAAGSFFIFVNSLSGFLGHAQKGMMISIESLPLLVLAVFLGGQLGARIGACRLPVLGLQRVAALLLLLVSINLLGKIF
ncbi:MAG: sulfite exporter TauE/SafE family protein [Candidatus Omnitrophica bacterium]|nr:sulfite exporter TauE/SafE family protein [Candidatus Omnitrophota bacterium]